MNKKYVVATWDDAPHLSDEKKKDLLASYPPHMRDARSKGRPQLGAGAIYPVPESEIVCDPFKIPPWWPKIYGMDVGWNRTAAVWGAVDNDSGIIYLYSEYYKGQAEPPIHAQGIRSRGEWIPGVIDPAARGRGQKDGAVLFNDYADLGLNIIAANNVREAGLLRVWEGLSVGRIKVFDSLRSWLGEFRIYRRDDKGNVVKKNDHLMDATRYLIMDYELAETPPVKDVPFHVGPTGQDQTGY